MAIDCWHNFVIKSWPCFALCITIRRNNMQWNATTVLLEWESTGSHVWFKIGILWDFKKYLKCAVMVLSSYHQLVESKRHYLSLQTWHSPKNLWYLNFLPAITKQFQKRDLFWCNLFCDNAPPEAANSSIMNIRRMSSLKRQIM